MMLDTPDQIDTYRFLCLIQAVQCYIKTDGKLRLGNVTPARMRELATEYTGQEYPRSRKGLKTALDDLNAIKARAMEGRS